MESPQLPREILVHISTYGDGLLMQQLLLQRSFYEYYIANKRHILQLHTRIVVVGRHTNYLVFNKWHREDGPAVIRADGKRRWYRNDKLHREDGPAVIYANGEQHWYQNGVLHRLDGPAIMKPNGRREWYQYGRRQLYGGSTLICMQRWYQHEAEKLRV